MTKAQFTRALRNCKEAFAHTNLTRDDGVYIKIVKAHMFDLVSGMDDNTIFQAELRENYLWIN